MGPAHLPNEPPKTGPPSGAAWGLPNRLPTRRFDGPTRARARRSLAFSRCWGSTTPQAQGPASGTSRQQQRGTPNRKKKHPYMAKQKALPSQEFGAELLPKTVNYGELTGGEGPWKAWVQPTGSSLESMGGPGVFWQPPAWLLEAQCAHTMDGAKSVRTALKSVREPIVRWHLRGNHHSSAGFCPFTVGLPLRNACSCCISQICARPSWTESVLSLSMEMPSFGVDLSVFRGLTCSMRWVVLSGTNETHQVGHMLEI